MGGDTPVKGQEITPALIDNFEQLLDIDRKVLKVLAQAGHLEIFDNYEYPLRAAVEAIAANGDRDVGSVRHRA